MLDSEMAALAIKTSTLYLFISCGFRPFDDFRRLFICPYIGATLGVSGRISNDASILEMVLRIKGFFSDDAAK